MDERVKKALFLGREHYEKREFEKAEPLLREALSHDERLADVHDMLGVIAHHRSEFDVAERHFERALELSPAYTEAALNLAVTYNDQGKYEAAREVYRRIKGQTAGAGIDPYARGKLANMHAALGEAYLDAGLPREAAAEYERAVALCPHFADLRTRLGTMLRDHGEVGRAIEHFEGALRAKPDYVPALLQLGVAFMMMGEQARAQASWERALTLDSENAQARIYLRTLHLRRESAVPAPATSGSTRPSHPDAAPIAPDTDVDASAAAPPSSNVTASITGNGAAAPDAASKRGTNGV